MTGSRGFTQIASPPEKATGGTGERLGATETGGHGERTAPKSSLPVRDRIGAMCGLGSLQFFVCEQLARLGWPGHYSLRIRFISDLGERSLCAGHAVMNASFFAQALLIAGAALLLPRRLAPGAAGALARGLLCVAALGLALVALAPADVNANLHVTGAQLHFAGSSLGLLVWGLAGRRGSRTARAALVAATVAVLGDAILVLFGGPVLNAFGPGLAERMAAYPLPLWLAYAGWRTSKQLRLLPS